MATPPRRSPDSSLLLPPPNPKTLHTSLPSPSFSAMAGGEATLPPIVGKAGRYTVFITPPSTPKPSEASPALQSPSPKPSPSPRNAATPVVQVPPQQFDKPSGAAKSSSGSVFGFFWDSVAKVRDVHSSLDEYLADWFGLNQSKYQWALNDYFESNGVDKEGGKREELAGKGQVV